MNEVESIKHEFVNNTLRLEILNKLASEELIEKSSISDDKLSDLKRFLSLQLELLEKISEK